MRGVLMFLIYAAVVGCAAPHPTTKAAVESAVKPTAECPSWTEQALRSSLKILATTRVHLVGCAKGRFIERGWAVSLWTEAADSTVSRGHAILPPDRNVFLYQLDPVAPSTRVNTHVVSLRAVDLTGDGIDEIIEHTIHAKAGISTGHITVLQADDASGLQRPFSKEVGFDNSGYVNNVNEVVVCAIDLGVSKPAADGSRSLVITGKVRGRPRSDQRACVDGRKEFRIKPLTVRHGARR